MFKMPEYFPNSSHKVVRYNKWKNPAEGDQYAEILIASSNEDKRSSEEDDRRLLSQLKICVHPINIFIVLLIFSLTLGTLYYFINILQNSPFEDKNNPNSNSLCSPLYKVEKVFLTVESTYLKPCSDNKTCQSVLDVIEMEHDGLRYNFVIGPGGELFVGSGFKCLVESKENALYVKLLKYEEVGMFEGGLKICSRLSEIINHGILCEKISKDYTQLVMYEEESRGEMAKEFKPLLCSFLQSGKNRSYHIHDPAHEMKLIHGDFVWTFCENFSSTVNKKKEEVLQMESLPKNTCSHLQIVNEIRVDVVETLPLDCSDSLSCLHEFEKYHEGFKYNFIIGPNYDLYVGLGFKCRAENTTGTDNVLKVKVLTTLDQVYSKYINRRLYLVNRRFLQIIDEGLDCGRISERFSVKANCNIPDDQDAIVMCRESFETLDNKEYVKDWGDIFSDNFENNPYHITSEHGKGVVPQNFRYQFCHRKQSPEISTDITTDEYNYEY